MFRYKKFKKAEPKNTRNNSTAIATTLNTGSFIVGEAIPKGRYVCTADSTSSGNFFVYDKNGIAVVNEILGYDDFGVPNVTINLQKGDIIEISGLNKVHFAAK